MFGLKTNKEADEQARQANAEGKKDGRQEGRNAVVREQKSNLSNLAKGSQVKFSVPYFDVFDPRFENFAVPVAVHGMLVYGVDDIAKYEAINKSQNVSDSVFEEKLKGQVTKFVKGVVANAPADNQIPVLQMERKILELSELVQRLVTPKIEQLFGINVRSFDIESIMVDKESRGYRELQSVTSDFERENLMARQKANLSSFSLQSEMQEEMQRMQLENQRETMRIQREEMQRAARLQTETNFLGAHQANLNAEVSRTTSMFGQPRQAAPQMPGMGMPPMPGMGMPPMPGMIPQVQYMVGVNGQQAGPFGWQQLQQLVSEGKLTQQTYVWKQGMAQWDMAGNVQELQPLFVDNSMPQMPQ